MSRVIIVPSHTKATMLATAHATPVLNQTEIFPTLEEVPFLYRTCTIISSFYRLLLPFVTQKGDPRYESRCWNYSPTAYCATAALGCYGDGELPETSGASNQSGICIRIRKVVRQQIWSEKGASVSMSVSSLCFCSWVRVCVIGFFLFYECSLFSVSWVDSPTKISPYATTLSRFRLEYVTLPQCRPKFIITYPSLLLTSPMLCLLLHTSAGKLSRVAKWYTMEKKLKRQGT